MLANKGYIQLNRSSEKNAEILLDCFEIASEKRKTTKGSLGKSFQELKNDLNVINPDDSAKFLSFPKRSDLKK